MPHARNRVNSHTRPMCHLSMPRAFPREPQLSQGNRRRTAAVPSVVQPLDLNVTAGNNEGSLDWHFHPVAGSIGMEVATTATPNDNASWVSRSTVSQSSGTITGLTSGIRTYVRIRAIGPNGPGPWSDLAGKMVP